MTAEAVTLVEVGPRDGLQNEKLPIPTGVKVRFIEALAKAGLRRIEATAFVSPRAIPQLADAEAVLLGIVREPGVRYGALVPNEQGLARALQAQADEVAVFTAASESFNRKNINASIEEAFERFKPVIDAARRQALPVRGYVSTAIHCPYEGRIDPAVAARVARRLVDLGCYEVSLGDTIGRATPREVAMLCAACAAEGILEAVAGHFHDTYGMAAANAMAAFGAGVRVFDASAGGLGGCPYAPGASGNVPTEDLVYLFEAQGITTGVDLDAVVRAALPLEGVLGRKLEGRVFSARRAAFSKEAP